MLKEILQAVVPEQLLEYNRERKSAKIKQDWETNGKPLPVPHIIKQLAIKEYAQQHKVNVLIETGTFAGDMIFAMRNIFKQIFSIELDESLHARATKKFEKYKHITLYRGDSAEVLPKILEKISEPCLLWLDGHYSGGITAKSNICTPILDEIRHVYAHSMKHKINHVILIDDARCFDGTGDYPELQDFKRYIQGLFPNYSFSVENDIISIVKEV